MREQHNQGASSIRNAFAISKAQKRCAILPFITAGYPSLAASERLLQGLAHAGADLVEVGFPFSDPISDGPVIAESMHSALVAGVTPDSVFDMVKRAQAKSREGSVLPLLAMVSISIVNRMGRDAFIARAVDAGFAGFIIPDADPFDAEQLSQQAHNAGAAYCALVAPTTPASRLETVARISTGFIYLLARAGVTGERSDAPEIAERVQALRRITDAPIAAGFGISTAQHIAAVGEHADGAIIGSAIVRTISRAIEANADPVAAALALVATYRAE